MITFNHAKFIAQAIEGVLQQTTTFQIELIIGEDFSTDNTRAICLKYQDKFPGTIKVMLPEKNIGMMPNFIECLTACTGKYIALCEGDDYWTDPLKLQKQVDFLEKNRDYSMCFHNAMIIYDDGRPSLLFNAIDQKEILGVHDIIEKWQITTASMLFRNGLLQLPVWFKDIHNGDYALQLMISCYGPVGYITNVMSVYRQHSTNLSATTSTVTIGEKKIELFLHLQEYYKGTAVADQIGIKVKSLKNKLIVEKMKKNFPLIGILAHLKRAIMAK
jgi:glycosyltransferase involved in cell wall biosynthesis